MNSNNRIRSAIESSSKSGQIASVDVDCTAGNLPAMLASTIVKCDWEMCHVEDDKVNVWGWTDDTLAGEQDWRIIVQCLPTIF